MARSRQNRAPRNTAPMWKKLSVVLSAPVAVVIVVRLLHATTWNFLPFVGAGDRRRRGRGLARRQAPRRALEPR